jgi:hypothetical protein
MSLVLKEQKANVLDTHSHTEAKSKKCFGHLVEALDSLPASYPQAAL